MQPNSPKRFGRFLHVVLGIIVGVALMSVVAAIVAGTNFRVARERAEHERTIADLREQVADLQRRAAIDQELNDARRDAQRIRAEIESRNERIRELERNLAASDCVAGQVTKIDGELATVNLGIDQGLELNHVLQVYRSILLQEHVGTIKLLKLEADRSVGLFTRARPGIQLKLGDVVGSRTKPK